ncbi:putative MFS transporter [Aspergillus tanneri]|uniref:Uncharacterized protein n=1 Tax=Aspergillus tanneri TaxID=1220188 RepID=A0A5M9N6A9_9EURO|nr:uncharacterized protein ATNIH1004_002808 [Aspergillus tanneri]KAA8650127.1 hypothetical protein ATNIH1004_002808 [Aspergillus tanneri]
MASWKLGRQEEPYDLELPAGAATHLGSLSPFQRKISYDMFPQTHPEAEDKNATAAYKVSNIKRFGSRYGSGLLGLGDQDKLRCDVEKCYRQDLKLVESVFTIDSITTNVRALSAATILCHFGSRVCGLQAVLH